MPRRPKRDRAAQVAATLPQDDRFAAHPNDPIDVVYVIGRAAHLVGARPKTVIGVMLASIVIAAVLMWGAITALSVDPERSGIMLFAILLAWSSGLLLQSPLVGAAIEVHTEHRGLSLEFLRRGLANIGTLIAAGLAVLVIMAVVSTVAFFLQLGLVALVASLPLGFVGVILVFVGSVTILVLALRIITAFSLVIPIILVEGLDVVGALTRSWSMGWPNGAPIYLALLLPALVARFVVFLSSFMPAFISIPTIIVMGIALVLYNSAIIPAAYVVIREYVEGLDPAQLLARKASR